MSGKKGVVVKPMSGHVRFTALAPSIKISARVEGPQPAIFLQTVIAEKRGLGVVRVIDQVKAYKPTHLVSANVRALMGVLHTDGASKGFVTTTSDFAPRLREDPLISPLIPSRLELINGPQLRERLIQISKLQQFDNLRETND